MTELLYMQDFNVETCSAQIIDVQILEDERLDVILDKTCFYARGGGQDWDTGEITASDNIFLVEEVRLDEQSVVHHIGRMKTGALEPGVSVECQVDPVRRSVNTRLHSAGHVLDMAVDQLGLDWVAGKGQHYPHLSAIEYTGTWDPDKAETLKDELERHANALINEGSENSIRFMPVAEMHKYCKQVPLNIPTNKPGRIVMYGDSFGIPCGGTHLKNIKDIEKLLITKLKQKKGTVRLSYSVEGIQ